VRHFRCRDLVDQGHVAPGADLEGHDGASGRYHRRRTGFSDEEVQPVEALLHGKNAGTGMKLSFDASRFE